MPIMGLLNIVRMLWKVAFSLKPSIEPLIISIPNIRIEKPSSMVPVFFFLSDFAIIVSKSPTRARTGVKDSGLQSFRTVSSTPTPSPPEMEAVLSNQAVTVVPMLAPIIMLMVCPSFIMPEFTKPTSITVVAEED